MAYDSKRLAAMRRRSQEHYGRGEASSSEVRDAGPSLEGIEDGCPRCQRKFWRQKIWGTCDSATLFCPSCRNAELEAKEEKAEADHDECPRCRGDLHVTTWRQQVVGTWQSRIKLYCQTCEWELCKGEPEAEPQDPKLPSHKIQLVNTHQSWPCRACNTQNWSWRKRCRTCNNTQELVIYTCQRGPTQPADAIEPSAVPAAPGASQPAAKAAESAMQSPPSSATPPRSSISPTSPKVPARMPSIPE